MADSKWRIMLVLKTAARHRTVWEKEFVYVRLNGR